MMSALVGVSPRCSGNTKNVLKVVRPMGSPVLLSPCADRAAEKPMVKQLTGTDEAGGRRCLSGLQVLIKQLTGADQLADSC